MNPREREDSRPGDSGFTIAPRYCGPPRSGNGGYVSGRLASFLGSPEGVAEVTLRSPPPLGVRLDVVEGEGVLALRNRETLVAQAEPSALAGEPPARVTFDEAVDAAQRYAGRRNHPFPTCFVCGLDRAPGDGLRLEPGSVGESRVAAAWIPHESLRMAAGLATVAPEFAWAALDCPGGWATDLAGRPMVLGRMRVRLFGLPEAGRRYVIVGQLTGLDGRKAFTASALYSADTPEPDPTEPDAGLLGHAEATWLAVDPAAVRPL